MTSRENRGARMAAGEGSVGGMKACHQAQAQLESAINSVLKAEQQLRDNVREVRTDLQSCVSRQQEALRCREVWLLDQIELLHQVKTETLQQQLQQLHLLSGQFDVLTHLLQNNDKDFSNQLTICMEKLSSLSLTPEETPNVSFYADTRSLRNAITSFGSINAQLVDGVSSQRATPERVQVHDYPITAKMQAPEGGALSDWLVATHPTCIPPVGHQSNKNSQDWLMSSSKENKTSSPALDSMDFLQAWGQLRDLEAWLLKEKMPVGRGRTVSSSSSTFSFEKIDESEFTVTPDEAELNDWLITATPVAMETASDAERWQQVFKPFSDSWVSTDWLVELSPPLADCSSCCQTIRAVEIENLGQLKCLKTQPPFTSPTVMTPPSTPAPAILESWLQQTVPVQQTCRANEICSSYSDCVCEGSCGREALNMWLLQQDGRDKNGVPVVKNTPSTDNHGNSKNTPPTKKNAPSNTKSPPALYQRDRKVHAILEAWLQPSIPAALHPHTPPLSDWLAPDVEKATREEHSSVFKPPPPVPESSRHHDDKWLLKKSQAQERLVLPVVCDLFSCMNVGGDKEKWLHRSPV